MSEVLTGGWNLGHTTIYDYHTVQLVGHFQGTPNETVSFKSVILPLIKSLLVILSHLSLKEHPNIVGINSN